MIGAYYNANELQRKEALLRLPTQEKSTSLEFTLRKSAAIKKEE